MVFSSLRLALSALHVMDEHGSPAFDASEADVEVVVLFVDETYIV